MMLLAIITCKAANWISGVGMFIALASLACAVHSRKKIKVPKDIRHSMDEQEFRDLVAGKKVMLKIDKKIFPNAPTVTVALQDIGWDRMFDAVMMIDLVRKQPLPLVRSKTGIRRQPNDKEQE